MWIEREDKFLASLVRYRCLEPFFWPLVSENDCISCLHFAFAIRHKFNLRLDYAIKEKDLGKITFFLFILKSNLFTLF